MKAIDVKIVRIELTPRELRELADAAEHTWSNRIHRQDLKFATAAGQVGSSSEGLKIEFHVDADAIERGY